MTRPTIARTVALLVALTAASACRRPPANGTGPYADVVAQAIPAVEKAVGLPFKTPPKIETRSKEQVRQFLLQQLADSTTLRDLQGKESAYKLLGMIPDTLDLLKLYTDLLTEQIVGFYDPKTKVLYVVNGASKEVAQTIVTHELVHALQDQYVSLDSVQKDVTDNDRATAAQAIFEGEAVYEQLVAMLGANNIAVTLPGGWERIRQTIRENRNAMPVYSSAPLLIQETLIFPYLSGAEFVREYKEKDPRGVPFRDMPVSTEQIMHPNTYFGTPRDVPTPMSFVTPGITPSYSNDLGEFETRVFLYQFLNNQPDAVRGASGWDGDRYIVFPTPHGRGMAWATVWDTQGDAADFYDLAQQVRTARRTTGRRVEVTTSEVNGRPVVLWVDVPDADRANMVTLANVRIAAKH
jgi:hypothetical protein